MKGYTTREVADLLGLSQQLIRRYAKSGLLGNTKQDGYRHKYDFQDIIILRTAKELLRTGVKPHRIGDALIDLKRDLPSHKSLSALRITGQGGDVVVQENQELYSPDSGQIHFNFSVADLAGSVAPITRKAVADAEIDFQQLTSEDWFDLGIDLEAVSPEDAPSAYLRALELDPTHADAHINLGRLLHESGEFDSAERHYQQALVVDPGNVLAFFNLGTLLEDMGKIQEAIDTYHKASAIADSHYNLSRLYGMQGKHSEALHHLNLYKGLEGPPTD